MGVLLFVNSFYYNNCFSSITKGLFMFDPNKKKQYHQIFYITWTISPKKLHHRNRKFYICFHQLFIFSAKKVGVDFLKFMFCWSPNCCITVHRQGKFLQTQFCACNPLDSTDMSLNVQNWLISTSFVETETPSTKFCGFQKQILKTLAVPQSCRQLFVLVSVLVLLCNSRKR